LPAIAELTIVFGLFVLCCVRTAFNADLKHHPHPNAKPAPYSITRATML
jgi:hypothetical protein